MKLWLVLVLLLSAPLSAHIVSPAPVVSAQAMGVAAGPPPAAPAATSEHKVFLLRYFGFGSGFLLLWAGLGATAIWPRSRARR